MRDRAVIIHTQKISQNDRNTKKIMVMVVVHAQRTQFSLY